MAPARVRKSQLHELAAVVAEKTVITDTRKQSFIIGKEFARGGFGRIYTGKQENSKDYGKAGSLAIKIEPHANGPLFTEITVFQRILMPSKLHAWMNKKKIDHLGLPPYISSGLFTYSGEKLRFLIMPRYEKPLESYRLANGGTLDLRVVLTVAKQCADCLSYMQDHDYVHADLKADNILLASANAFSKCFLVDFGLAKMAKGNVDKPDKKRAHNGTLLFTSLDAHRGCAPSYRGDLEILGYNILYWLCGTLPWQKCTDKPEAVMVEKQKFAKEPDKSIKKLVQDGCVPLLSKIFKLAYETPYLNKVDYTAVHAILNQIKVPKEVSGKENVKTPRRRSRGDARDSLPATSRKRKNEPADASADLRKYGSMDFSIVLTDALEVQNNGGATTGQPALGRISKVKPVSNRTPISSPTKAGSSESPEKPPEPKRRRSDRIASQLLSKETDESSTVSGEKFEKSLKSGSSKQPEIAVNKSPKKSGKKLRQKPRTGLRSITKSTAASSASPSSSKSKKMPESPGQKLGRLIPGVRNMKNVRRSLKDTLLKKYVSVANRAQEEQHG